MSLLILFNAGEVVIEAVAIAMRASIQTPTTSISVDITSVGIATIVSSPAPSVATGWTQSATPVSVSVVITAPIFWTKSVGRIKISTAETNVITIKTESASVKIGTEGLSVKIDFDTT